MAKTKVWRISRNRLNNQPKLRWQEYHPTVNFTGGADPARIDFTAASFGATHEVGYAFRGIHSDKARLVRLKLSTQTFAGTIGLTAWLNGADMYAKPMNEEPQHRIDLPAQLQQGWNCLALKCNHLTWQWQVSAGVEGVDGDGLSDPRYPAEAPAGKRIEPVQQDSGYHRLSRQQQRFAINSRIAASHYRCLSETMRAQVPHGLRRP